RQVESKSWPAGFAPMFCFRRKTPEFFGLFWPADKKRVRFSLAKTGRRPIFRKGSIFRAGKSFRAKNAAVCLQS
ncbi:MAG: hypothetical protein ACPLRH_06535, partial [Desulfotomaculales bacterium]